MKRIGVFILVAGIGLALPAGVRALPPEELKELQLPFCSELQEAGLSRFADELNRELNKVLFLNKKIQAGYKGTRLQKNTKAVGRSYLLADCFPTQWASVSFDESLTIHTELRQVRTIRIKFGT